MKKKLLCLIGLGVLGFVVYDICKYLNQYDPKNFEDEDIFDDEFEDWDSSDDFFEEEDNS